MTDKSDKTDGNGRKVTKKQVLMVTMMVVVAFGAWQYAAMNAGSVSYTHLRAHETSV